MDIFEIRRENVVKLIRSRFGDSQADFARAIKKTPGYIWQQISGHRRIGEKAARDIEATLRLPDNFLDVTTDGTINTAISEPETPHYGPTPAALALANRIDQLPLILRPPVIATLEAMEAFARPIEKPAPASGVDDATVDKIAALLLEHVKANRASTQKPPTKKKAG